MAKESDWTKHHRKAMRRFRDFWMKHLGEQAQLIEVNAAMVETLAKELEASPETRRKYLVYITGAYRFAVRKLKWLDARHDLSAVDLPKGKGKSRAYSMAEVMRLLPALEEVGVEAGWIGHVAWQSGRRLGAIRTLPKSAATVSDDFTVLEFPGETDKARNTGQVVIVGRAHELTRQLMESRGGYVLGAEPPSETTCIRDWLGRAEQMAGIQHLQGRGWHGIKRRYATASRGMAGRDKQSGTRTDTLEQIYVQDDLEPKKEIAQRLSASLTASIER